VQEEQQGKIGIEGNLYSVLEKLHKKRQLLYCEDNSHEQIRTAFVFEQGGWAGIFQVAVSRGFEEAGFDAYVVDDVFGSSTGAFSALFYIVGNSLIGGRMYQEAVAKKAIDYTRFVHGSILNVKCLEEIFKREIPDAGKKLAKARTRLWITHTFTNGTGTYRYLNCEQDPILHIIASGNVPIMSREKFKLYGQRIYDGGIFDPNPVKQAGKHGANVIICFLTQPPDQDLLDTAALSLISLAPMDRRLKEQIRFMSIRRAESIAFIRTCLEPNSSIDVVLLYPTYMPVRTFETDEHKVNQAYSAFLKQTKQLLNPHVHYPTMKDLY
jgi:predicted patatin/cPLA2 family phospholipase